MAKKTPNLDSWMRTFKDVGSFAKETVKASVSNMLPGITTTIDSTTQLVRESKGFVSKTKNQVNTIYNSRLRGNNPMGVINSAYDDIRNGNFSLDKLSDSAFDSMDSMEDSLNHMNIDDADPASVAMGESKKNMAMLGKVVAEGNVASIEGMKNMTSTMANVSIKTSNASSAKIVNATLAGFSQSNAYLAGVSNRLDTINANIVSMVNFQKDVLYQSNQAALNYYAESSEMLKQMGGALVEMKDFISQQKELENAKKETPEEFSFKSAGYQGYKDLIKKNFSNSPVGMGLEFLKMGSSMASISGENPLQMIAEMAFESLIPKNVSKTMRRTDNLFSATIDNMLYSLGDLSTKGGNIVTRTLGTLFGLDKKKSGAGINLSNFKRDSMGWNGIAQKTLVEVIPSYLANIESAITKQETRFFDMETGRFMNRDQLSKEFSTKANSHMEVGMESFTSMIERLTKEKGLSLDDNKDMQETINKMVKERVLDNDNKTRKEFNQEAYNAFRGRVSEDDARDLIIELNAGISGIQRSLKEFNNDIASGYNGTAYRQLFNTKDADINPYYETPNVFERKQYVEVNGKKVDVRKLDPNSKEYRAWKAKEEDYKIFDKGIKGFFGKDKKKKEPSKVYGKINSVMNTVYDKFAGIDTNAYSSPDTGLYSSASINPATSVASKKQSRIDANFLPKKVKNEVARVSNTTFENINKMKRSTLVRNATNTANMITDNKAGIEGNVPESNETTLSKLVVSLHDNFLAPIIGGLFGADGFFKKIFDNEHVKKLKEKLFNKETGLFGGLTVWYEDQMNALKHVFTGKGYTKSDGEIVGQSKDNVFNHLTNGYDFVFSNVMKKFFGEEFKDKDTYKKYFEWLDIKGRRERKKQKLAEELTESEKSTGEVASPLDKVDTNKIQSNVEKNIADGSAKAGNAIAEGGEKLADELFGDAKDERAKFKISDEANKSIMDKAKKFLPFGIAAGIGGAALGGLIGAKGAGLVGSFFLPGGPIGGAIVATGLALASRSEGLKNFIFGKEGDENKKLGVISKGTQDFVKKNMPLIAGGAAVGLLKNIAFGTGDGLVGALVGGPIAGAALSVGIGLLKNNKKIQSILFGNKVDKDGNPDSKKTFGGIGKAFEKTGHFVKGGIKGLGIGAMTGATLSQMGILGAAVSAGGPIGMGVVGLGIGIASQTKKFQDLLFGTEEFDEDGNLKGRAGNGLLTKVRNMLVINVLEPLKTRVEDTAIDLAFWAKEAIIYPFRNAFGVLLEPFKEIGRSISELTKNAFDNIAEVVGATLKGAVNRIFKPFTSILKKIGGAAFTVTKMALKASLTPITLPLKLLELATAPKRIKNSLRDKGMMAGGIGDIIYQTKMRNDEDSEEGKFDGPFHLIRKGIGTVKNFKGTLEAAQMAINEEMTAQGKNTLNHRNIPAEKRQDKINKKKIKSERKRWKKIDSYRNDLIKENGYADIDYTEGKLNKIRKQFGKLGIKEGLDDNEQLRLLLKDRDGWKKKFYNKGNEATMGAFNKDGSIKESPATKQYQEYMMSKFDYIVKRFTIYTANRELSDKKNINPKTIKEMTQRFKDTGIDWKDIGIDPADLSDVSKLSDEEFDEILGDAEKGGKFKSGKINFSSSFAKILNRQTESNKASAESTATTDDSSRDELIAKTLQNVDESTRTSAILAANNGAIDSGASSSDIETATGLKFSTKNIKIARLHLKNKEKAERLAKEAAEDAKVKVSGKSFQDEEDDESKATLPSEDEEVQEEAKKTGTGFFKSIAEWLGKKETWDMLGFGTVLAAIFAPNLKDLATNIFGAVAPVISNAATAIGSWWSTNGSTFVSSMVGTLCDNMGFIVDNAVKIAGSVVSTVGKKAANGIASGLGFEEPFADMSNSKTKEFDTVAEAESYGYENNQNVYVDASGQAKVLDDRTDIDANGEETRVGDAGFKGALGKEAYWFVRSPLNRALATGTVKTIFKVGGYIPSKIIKAGVGIGKGIYNTGKNIADARAAYKAGKSGASVAGKVAEDVVDSAVDKAKIEGAEVVAKETVDKAGETLAKNADNMAKATTKVAGEVGEAAVKKVELKGVKKFLSKATGMINGFLGKFADKIGLGKLKKWILKIITKIGTKLASSNVGIIKKIGERITKRTAEAAAKTAASGSTAFALDTIFVVWGAVNGAINPGYLFGVSNSETDWKMRTVAAVLQGLLSTSAGSWLDIVLEVWGLLTGSNPKQWAARALYSIIASDEEESELEKATNELAAETEKYNRANGTNLSTDAYLEKKSKGDSLGGKLKKYTIDKLMLSSEEWDAKYDYSKYAVSDEETASWVARNDALAKSAASNSDNVYSSDTSSASVTQEQINSYSGNDLLEGYGPGRKKSRINSVGYGGTMLQSDSRWASLPIGKFPDGTTSTMSTGGCGPTALAMVANEMGNGVNPVSVANYAKNKGYIQDGGATTGLFTDGAKELGLNPNTVNKSSLKDSLKDGKPAIISGKSNSAYGPYTEAGHVIKATGLDANGNAIIDDPMRGRTTASLDSITSGMTHGWTYDKGGSSYGRGSRAAIGYGDTAEAKYETPPNGVEIKMGIVGDDVGSTYNGQQYFIYKDHKYTQIMTPEGNTIKTYWINEDLVVSEAEDSRRTKVDSTVVLAKNEKTAKKIKKTFKGATLKTIDKVNRKIKEGYEKDSDGTMNFNVPDFYEGLNQIDLSLLAKYDKTLLTNSDIVVFKYLYDYFVSNKTRFNKSPHTITASEIASILNAHGIGGFFGQNGKVGEYEYKNNFPFFPMNDERWNGIKWRNSTVDSTGDDLTSLAMISSAYGNNMIPPDYIYNNWLSQYPQWWSANNGLEVDEVFADGGFNAMMSTQIDGKRLKVEEIKNFSTIKSSMQARKPVFLTGYQYDGSIFGGNQDPEETDKFRTLIGVAANDTHMAVNDPSSKAEDPGIFEIDSLKEYIDSEKKKKLIKKAYVVSGPNGEGMEAAVNLSEKVASSRDYQEISEAQGLLGKLSAIFHNMGAIALNLIDSNISGEKYKSIFDLNKIENDGSDETGVGNAYIPATEEEEKGETVETTGNSTTVYADGSDTTTTSQSDSAIIEGQEAIEPQPAPAPAPSVGGGSKDLPIGYGKKLPSLKTLLNRASTNVLSLNNSDDDTLANKKNTNKKKNEASKYLLNNSDNAGVTVTSHKALTNSNVLQGTLDELQAINYANQTSLLGGDYRTGKAEYYAALEGTSTDSEDNGNSSNNGNVNNSARDIKGGKTEEKVWNYFTGLGYSDAATAGILGNLYQESKFNPACIQGNGKGPAAGIAQWENYNTKSSRWKNLYDYAERNGYKWTDLAVQLEFIDKELKGNSAGPYFKYKRVVEGNVIPETTYEEWKKSTDIKEATLQFEKAFERAGTPNMPTRITAANKYYKLYSGNVVNGIGSLFGRKSRAIGYGASWLAIVQSVKSALASLKLGYSKSRYIKLDVLGERLDNVRTDCSGFVSACLRLYGSLASNLSSSGLVSTKSIKGFTKGKWNGWDKLQTGDIIASSGHVEIFAENKNGQHYVYNCGGHSSCNNPNPTISSKDSYTTVWRPNETGNVADMAVTDLNNVDDSAATTTTSGVRLSSPLDGVFSVIASTSSDDIVNKAMGYGLGSSDPASWFTDTLGGHITSDYGQRNSGLGNEFHRGLDIGADSGSPILSPVDGTIVSSGTDVAGYGNYAVVQDRHGNNHVFAHMNKPVGYGVGSNVSRNDIIGEVGSTGKSTGSHLHYEIRKSGNKYSTINPASYKYDSEVSRNLNITNRNLQTNEGYGSGNKDLSAKEASNKLDVALNTKNVENKLDSLIEVMKMWADRDAKDTKATQNINQVNNNTTVSYGSGKKTVKKSSSSSAKFDPLSMSLSKIHETLATK